MIEDEIVEIECVGYRDMIDINVSGNRLFYANNILTHNSAVDEVEFDHSHISGGISKINTSDNVFGIFTSRAMRERGRYEMQCMKSRSSTGVGLKVELDYNVETMRITDSGEDANSNLSTNADQILKGIKSRNTAAAPSATVSPLGSVKGETQSTKLKQMLASIKSGD